MSDIFISYSQLDRDRVQKLANVLESLNFSVWWDRQIPAGKSFDSTISKALAEARAIIVVWSSQSIASHWVLEEAEVGRMRGVLIPVLFDRVTPPLGFGRIQAVDLIGWDGDPSSPGLKSLAKDLQSCLSSAPVTNEQPRPEINTQGLKPAARTVNWRRPRFFAVFAVTFAIISGVFLVTYNQISPLSPDSDNLAGVETAGESNPPLTESIPTQAQTRAQLSRQNSGLLSERINLLAANNGGQLFVADSGIWTNAIDEDEASFGFDTRDPEAVFGFDQDKSATFDTFTVLIEETSGYNLKEFELLVGNESPTGQFRSLGKFRTLNAKLFKTPYQEFSFEPSSGRFVKIRLLSPYDENAFYIYAREFQLWGKLDSSSKN